MINKKELSNIYKRYGFEEQESGSDGVLVFTLRAGHFHNADIVLVKEVETLVEEGVFSNFKRSGFACKVRRYLNIQDVEKQLFEGFFSATSTKKRLAKEYEKFTSAITSPYSDGATYSYIKSNYFVNGQVGNSNVVSEILNRIYTQKPILFLIEAAAGFGKTCTAYELLISILNDSRSKVPIFTELSRNRQAKIFRYVLLDEIDRSFPLLSSQLVRSEIKKGNVPVILDGFDELLHRSEDKDGYENAEPMLETIGELLQERAKIVLTTRRTAIFDGDEFHDWMGSHEEDFEVLRIRIDEPTVDDWLPAERLDHLAKSKFDIKRLSNPVLLSYLRCISLKNFMRAISSPDDLVEKYFSSMLEREKTRQDLRINEADQYKILKSIASNMIEFNYTSESREYIISVIEENYIDFLDSVRQGYSADERPSSDEILNKLASHALLDRSSEGHQGIGFVNEFVLGNFCAEIIIEDSTGEWAGDHIFVEPSVLSYRARSDEKKQKLWRSLQFIFEFVDFSEKVDAAISLTNSLDFEIREKSIENIFIADITFAKNTPIFDTVFVNCKISNVIFELKNMHDVTFIGCNFYNCRASDSSFPSPDINMLGCSFDDDNFSQLFSKKHEVIVGDGKNEFSDNEIFVLEKFWPVGRQTFMKHRPIKGICVKTNHCSHKEITDAIGSLKHRGYLLSPDSPSFLELNVDKIGDIKEGLGKN